MMKVRRAVLNDVPEIDRMLRQVLNVHHAGRPDLFKANAQKYDAAALADMLADPKTPAFVAVDGPNDETRLGYALCVFRQYANDPILTDVKTLYLDDLCVDESARGRGVGRALYERVLSFAKESGCYNVTLNVWARNENALRFYEKLGLTPQKIGLETIL